MFELFASGHHPPPDSGMTSSDIIGLVKDLGIPMVTALCCLWFIRYIYDQNAKERENSSSVMRLMIKELSSLPKTATKP